MKRLIQYPIFLLFISHMATSAAVTIDAGPTWSPPGLGAETASGSPAFSGGLTYTYTGIDLGQTQDLYYGIKNDLYSNGFSTDGGGISGSEIFDFSTVVGNSIIYTGQTSIQTLTGVYLDDIRMTLTFSGPGTIIQDATTMALSNANGGVGALWHVAGDFSVNILMEAKVVEPGDPNYGNWEPGNDLFNRLQTTGISSFGTGSSVDTGFYYSNVTGTVAAPGTLLLLGPLLLGLGTIRRNTP